MAAETCDLLERTLAHANTLTQAHGSTDDVELCTALQEATTLIQRARRQLDDEAVTVATTHRVLIAAIREDLTTRDIIDSAVYAELKRAHQHNENAMKSAIAHVQCVHRSMAAIVPNDAVPE